MQEQMIFKNNSGELQEVESTSHWEIVLRFQFVFNDSKFSFPAEPRQALVS